jgi:CheY-like chemotaxis protein
MSRKLLLADDSITIQKVIGITFAHEDYQLTVVDNGDTALQKARQNRPDLVLADVFMPGKNGYELCAAIKGDPLLAHVPVLLLSGTFEPFDEQKAREAGADSWISKPFESQALIERVEGLLNRPQPTAIPVPPPAMQAVATTAPVAPPVAPVQPVWEDVPAMPANAWAETSPGVADAWDDSSWQEVEAPAPANDPWQEIDEPSAAAPREDEFSWEEPALVAPVQSAPQMTAAYETPGDKDEEDPWGSVSFGEEDLLGEFGGSVAADDDLLDTAGDTPAIPAPAAPQTVAAPIARAYPTAPGVPIAPAAPAPSVAPVALEAVASGPAVIEWDDDEIIPLDDLEILEEEDLESDFSTEDKTMPMAMTMGVAAVEEELFDPFAADEDRGLALQQETVTEFSFPADSDAAPPTFEDPWGVEEEPLTESDPAARELLTAPLHEPDWSSEVSSGAFEAEEEEFLLNPAEVAMEAASQMPAVAPAGSPIAEEQLGVYLKEEDLAALVEKVAGTIIEKLAGSILERIVWEVVPDMAETLIKDEIRRIKEEVR